MADSARVAGQIHAARNFRRATQTGAQGSELRFRELGSLLNENPVKFKALVLHIIIRPVMAEFDGGAVCKEHHPHSTVVGSQLRRDHLPHREDDVLLQFRVLPPDDQNTDARIGQRTAKGFHPQDVCLAAATGAAVSHISRPGLAKQLLLWIQVPQVHIHCSATVFERLVCHVLTFPGIS